jgi:hypothetical protein
MHSSLLFVGHVSGKVLGMRVVGKIDEGRDKKAKKI